MNFEPSQVAPSSLPAGAGSELIESTGEPVSVEEGYRRWAPAYDGDPNPLLALEERCLRPMLPCLAGKRALDLACGTGRWLSRLLADGAGFAVGVDISTAMLARGQEKAGLRGRLVRADCRNNPFAPGVFDLVVCSFALGHFLDLDGVVREVARVTTPVASVFVSDLHPRAYAQGWRTGFRDAQGAAEIKSWPHAASDLLGAWNGAGFDCLRFAECRLGESERPIFAQAGKTGFYGEACQVPAVLILHFQRRT